MHRAPEATLLTLPLTTDEVVTCPAASRAKAVRVRLLEHEDRRGDHAVTGGIRCQRVEEVISSLKIVGVPVHGVRTGVAGAAHGANKNAVTVDPNRPQS